MSNPSALDHFKLLQFDFLRNLTTLRHPKGPYSRHYKFTNSINVYNKDVAAKGVPIYPFELSFIREIDDIQREINPPIRPWLAYGCGLAMVVCLHIKFLGNKNIEWKHITKPRILLVCFAWSLLTGLVVKAEVSRSATRYVQRTLEYTKELATHRETIPMEVVKVLLGWRWYWVRWKPWRYRHSRPGVMHLQLTNGIKLYNKNVSVQRDLDPRYPFEQILIDEINEIQCEINPPIRSWFAYGCGLAMVVFLHKKFLGNKNIEWKHITKPRTLLACFAWSLLAGLIIKAEVSLSATRYVQMILEYIKELAEDRETIPMELVKVLLGWRWHYVRWGLPLGRRVPINKKMMEYTAARARDLWEREGVGRPKGGNSAKRVPNGGNRAVSQIA